MPTLTEGRHAGGFLVWEASRDYCREAVTIAAGTLAPGTVLGRITVGSKYATHDPDASDGTETAVAVLWDKADASAGDAPAVAIVRGPAIVNRHDLVFAGTRTRPRSPPPMPRSRPRASSSAEGDPDMATMDIFEGDAFSIIELTRALENMPFKPATLSASGLFSDRGVRTRTVVIESRDGTLSLIPFSERGSAHDQQVPERREVRAFVCRQFKKQDVIWASEIQGVRDFGTESAAQQVQTEVAHRLRRLRTDAEATFEYHFLNGLQGLVKDPKDGAMVVNYFTEFAIAPAAEIDFDLDNASPASGALRKRCQALIESVEESMGGLATGAVQLRAECGSAFFADLVAHKEVRETYLNTAAANELRRRVVDEFSFGGITFRRYGGNATIGVPTDKAYFYPEGIEGLFEIYYAPADTFETVNTLGLPLYARMIPDRERDEWVRLEIESNPLPICTRPQVLRSARRT